MADPLDDPITVERDALPGVAPDLVRFTPPVHRVGQRILLIHENRGLVPYMREVGAGLAAAGHAVVAPDLLTRLGGTNAFAHDPDSVSTRQIDEATHLSDLESVYDRLAAEPGVVSIAVVGLCFGAEMGWALITRRPVDVAVLWYGICPDPDAAATVGTRILAAYAEDDERVNRTVGSLVGRLAGSAVDCRLLSYPGTRHAFHDHHRPDRHHSAAADHLWRQTLAFLDEWRCAP